MKKDPTFLVPHNKSVTSFCMTCGNLNPNFGACQHNLSAWHPAFWKETYEEWDKAGRPLIEPMKRCKAITSNLGQKAAARLRRLADMVEAKNAAYGDSLGSPIRFFSDGEVTGLDLILARMDDKVSRMMKGDAAGEDPADDLLVYAVLAMESGWNLTQFIKSKGKVN